MHSWWVVGPVGLSAVLLRGVFGRRSTHRRGKKDEDSTREEGSMAFTCERVCTSEALLKRLGSLAKDPTPNTCVTVCGMSAADACAEACQRAVCTSSHQVPAWNDQCLKRCSTECQWLGRA